MSKSVVDILIPPVLFALGHSSVTHGDDYAILLGSHIPEHESIESISVSKISAPHRWSNQPEDSYYVISINVWKKGQLTSGGVRVIFNDPPFDGERMEFHESSELVKMLNGVLNL